MGRTTAVITLITVLIAAHELSGTASPFFMRSLWGL